VSFTKSSSGGVGVGVLKCISSVSTNFTATKEAKDDRKNVRAFIYPHEFSLTMY